MGLFDKQKRKKSGRLFGAGSGDETRELYALQNPKAPVVEAFRALRTNVSFAAADRTYRTLLVTSPTPGDGKSTVTANLGAVIAQAGKKVLLIDGDLRKPVLHQIFSVANLLGLTNILVQGRKVSEAARETPISGLYFVPSGPIPPNPSELIASVRMAGLLEEAREQYDVVLLDSPPMVTVTDAALLSTRVDGVMLVVKAGVTRLDLVNDAIGQIRKASANFMGVVLNQVRVPSHDYHYYYYYGHRSKETEIRL